MLTGEQKKAPSNAPSYPRVFADSLIAEAAKDDKICAVTAAMPDGTGLNLFAERYPSRCFDVGIAEQHGVTFSAGLAAGGMKPFCTMYSTFLQRAIDSIIHDVAIQGLPVIFAMDRAGLVGADGATHQGVFDITYLRMIPDMVCMAPSDENELTGALATALQCEGPSAFRFPRGTGPGTAIDARAEAWPLGKARWVHAGEGAQVSILSLGPVLEEACAAAQDLAHQGIATNVLDMRFIKPLDEEAILGLARDANMTFITAEEGVLAGGFGSAVLELLSANGCTNKVARIGLPDRFVEHGSVAKQSASAGLDRAGFVAAARRLVTGQSVAINAPEVSH